MCPQTAKCNASSWIKRPKITNINGGRLNENTTNCAIRTTAKRLWKLDENTAKLNKFVVYFFHFHFCQNSFILRSVISRIHCHQLLPFVCLLIWLCDISFPSLRGSRHFCLFSISLPFALCWISIIFKSTHFIRNFFLPVTEAEI